VLLSRPRRRRLDYTVAEAAISASAAHLIPPHTVFGETLGSHMTNVMTVLNIWAFAGRCDGDLARNPANHQPHSKRHARLVSASGSPLLDGVNGPVEFVDT
jgi:hypothetical protein